MIQSLTARAVLAAMLTVATAAPAWALNPPPADPDKCGGLVCDLGLFKGGHDPHALPCNDFFCRAFGGREAPPPAPVPVATPPEPEPVKPTRHAKARHVKSVAAKATKKAPDAPASDAAPANAGVSR